MPDQIAKELADHLRQETINHLWRQWKAVGATVSVNTPAEAIVDPEALVLMSFWMVEHERRLSDVVWSWVTVNSPLLSIQRLGNLKADFPADVARRLSALATLRVREAKDHRWKSLQKGSAAGMSKRSAKVRAIEPRFRHWASLMLQLRLGLGVGVKADVLTLLLGLNTVTPAWAGVSSIAESLGYTTAAVRRAADDLARARFLRLLETSEGAQSAQRMFSAQAGAWTNLLGVAPSQPGWGHWRERYLFLVELLTWLDRVQVKQIASYAMDVEARKILTRHALALRLNQVVDSQEFAVADLDLEYLVQVSRALTAWLRNNG